MVAGAVKTCRWRYKKQVKIIHSEYVISWVKQKKEFTRGLMEKSMGLTLAQSEWWIKELRKKKIIKNTNRHEYKLGKGQRQIIYKYIEK